MEQISQEAGRDVIHHDCHDDLMGAGLCFQPTDDPSPECATEQAAHSGEEEVDAGRQMPAEADVGGYDRAQDRLTLSLPMLNNPARKASPTPRPAQISGAAWAVVSVIGP